MIQYSFRRKRHPKSSGIMNISLTNAPEDDSGQPGGYVRKYKEMESFLALGLGETQQIVSESMNWCVVVSTDSMGNMCIAPLNNKHLTIAGLLLLYTIFFYKEYIYKKGINQVYISGRVLCSCSHTNSTNSINRVHYHASYRSCNCRMYCHRQFLGVNPVKPTSDETIDQNSPTQINLFKQWAGDKGKILQIFQQNLKLSSR